jgi:hypothetical protein
VEIFAIRRPVPTHWREATCEEVDCVHYLQGWVTLLDPSHSRYPELRMAVQRSGRRYRVARGEDVGQPAGLEAYVFEAGQRCFREHRLPVEREPEYLQQRRGRLIRHPRWESWRDEFNDGAYRAGRLING